ncbi:MAG TPA: redoxin domain-containing protein [Flavobacteriales bacterium]|jgi:cytochrome oxidase Cu insertion factor (SCO1/SenC/PrrC family)|nr:redoxin domain-containing protein [Flavobacteriales bacterium]
MQGKLLTSFVAFLAFSGVNAQIQGYNVGEVVDDFTVTDTQGNEHNLYEITASGKHVILDFFFDTCPPC